MIHLDTSFLIRALEGDGPEDEALRNWLSQGDELVVSAPAWGEFLCGPVPADVIQDTEGLLTLIMPLTRTEAAIAADMFNAGGRRRGIFTDCLIAACAVSADVPIATANQRDFARFVPNGLYIIEYG